MKINKLIPKEYALEYEDGLIVPVSVIETGQHFCVVETLDKRKEYLVHKSGRWETGCCGQVRWLTVINDPKDTQNEK